MSEQVQTVIIGGGQAGLATSYWLKQHRHEHVILEQAAQAANAWRNNRWDSFTLITPNWATRMPASRLSSGRWAIVSISAWSSCPLSMATAFRFNSAA